MTTPNLYRINAFATEPFRGNPAAVVFLNASKPDSWFQGMAAEMNLPETAFLLPEGEDYRLRWFTPTVEVPLCGHATLASAHAIWTSGLRAFADGIRFRTLSGVLTARFRDEWIELDFPAEPPKSASLPVGLLEALGINEAPVATARNRLGYVVELAHEETVRALKPDFPRLEKLGDSDTMVTARSTRDPEVDFVSRFFAPSLGIPEDPVTGAAHCCLGPYWKFKLGGRDELVGYQASARGGEVRVRMQDDRVFLSGKAITLFAGTLT